MPRIPYNQDEAFNCLHCGAYAHQIRGSCTSDHYFMPGITATQCNRCKKFSLWVGKKMVYPIVGDAPLPNEDLPEEIKKDYLEARSILGQSPRGAAALLRLAIDKLCNHLKVDGKNLNNKIKNLVKKGLPEKVQKALDIVRVTGNKAVHPGQIDVDTIDTAKTLFKLVNIIANHMISENKQIATMYNKLPASAKKQISKRDDKE